MRLKDKVIIITGSGSGIGKSTALLFAQHGGKIVVSDIDVHRGEETVLEIKEQNGDAIFIETDVTDASSVERLVLKSVETYGRIDVLFNNAGISCVGQLHEIEPEEWDRVMSVNIKGVYLPSKYVVPYMISQQGGTIINMSSCIAEIGLGRRAAYAASKGAVLALTKSMQVDYAKYNIRVNALLPGTIFTPFVEQYLQNSYDDPEAAVEQLKKRQLSGQLGRPEDVAKAALFLASDESAFMLGSPLYIDGGVVFGKDA